MTNPHRHYRILMLKRRKINENEIFSFIILINTLIADYFHNFFFWRLNCVNSCFVDTIRLPYSFSLIITYTLFFFPFHTLANENGTNPINIFAHSTKVREPIVYRYVAYVKSNKCSAKQVLKSTTFFHVKSAYFIMR
jgi:hypothetical protein